MKKDNTKNKKEVRTYDTKIGVIAKKYNVSFNVPNDTKIGDFLKKKGYKSAAAFLR